MVWVKKERSSFEVKKRHKGLQGAKESEWQSWCSMETEAVAVHGGKGWQVRLRQAEARGAGRGGERLGV